MSSIKSKGTRSPARKSRGTAFPLHYTTGVIYNFVQRVRNSTFLILLQSHHHHQSSFNSVFSSSPKVAEYNSFPPQSLSLLPSISFDLQLLRSSTRLSSHSLPLASSMSVLAVLAFAVHSLPSSLPSSVYYHLLF